MVDFKEIERKWQKKWQDDKIFEADPNPNREKFFLTVAYPYPNSPQHVGHARTYTLTDSYARFKRMQGFNVLYPQGFHYTGTPILAMANRIAENDRELIETFQQIYKVPSEVISTFNDPLTVANYFHNEIREGMKKIGFSIDWRREFTTIDPAYMKFIEWQFHTLHKGGYVTKGSHPVGWCPLDQNAVGQHDTLGDKEPEMEEITALKFPFNGWYMPTATYRPETVFGVTNVWVNPDADYVIARVDGAQLNGEKWFVSKEFAKKLVHQIGSVEILQSMKGHDVIGKTVKNPLTGKEGLLILPGTFVEPDVGTGCVMSVPAHAPYDYIALEDLKKNLSELEKYGIDLKQVEKLVPISLISIEGYSDFPARDAVEKFDVKDQNDPKCKDATDEIYSAEFRSGILKEITGNYQGLPVSEAKEMVKNDMIAQGSAYPIYEIVNAPIRCRCGTEVVVKVVQDQWFINYGDPAWKELAYECLDNMSIIPKELIGEYRDVINWLTAKACARKSGLGTPLPWDPDWIIESLSDSTIYMAYYTLAKFINQYTLTGDNFNDAVFDYIFLGQSNAKDVSKSCGLNPALLESMKEEFNYWYPLDSRHSGRDLIWNHLTFMIFNHTAIFSRENWPQQIVVNGSVLMEEEIDGKVLIRKMSKSLRNIIPIHDAIRTYGADAIRLSVLSSAEILSDAVFSERMAKSMGNRLERLYNFAQEISSKKVKGTPQFLDIDRWILSLLQHRIERTTVAMNLCRVRDAIQNAFFLLDQDVAWYLKRINSDINIPERSDVITAVLQEVLDVWIRLLSPFAPFICEEIWQELLEKEDYVSIAPWPVKDESKIMYDAEAMEDLLRRTIDDTQEILKVTNISPKRIVYYVAQKWASMLYMELLQLLKEGKSNQSEIMNTIFQNLEIKKHGKQAAKLVQKLLPIAKTLSPEMIEQKLSAHFDELTAMKTAVPFIENTFSTTVEVYEADDPERYDPMKKANSALPGRAAIFIE
ncbi:MAG: leucine--tRNA ligase [Promethearchaeota archaeon]